MAPGAEVASGIGRDLFDLKLHTAHMIRENADELLRFGERLRREAVAELERLAPELRANTPWRDVVRMLREPRGYPGANCNLVLPATHPEADAG